MKMIKEEYVKWDTAKLLKAAGFPQDIKQTMFYNQHGQDYHFGDGYWGNGYAKPSQAQAMRWLREEKNLTIIFELFTPSEVAGTDINPGSYAVDIYGSQKGYHLFSIDEPLPLPTYEAAAEAGIQEACKYIIKNKNQ